MKKTNKFAGLIIACVAAGMICTGCSETEKTGQTKAETQTAATEADENETTDTEVQETEAVKVISQTEKITIDNKFNTSLGSRNSSSKSSALKGNSSNSSASRSSVSKSGTSTRKSSSNKTVFNADGYDEGYDAIYDDDDYDWDRYQRDDDYARGVDDAMDELEDDW